MHPDKYMPNKYMFDTRDVRIETPADDVVIHPTAVVAKGANLGKGVQVGAYSVIGPNVVLEDYVHVGSHCVVEHRTTVGSGSTIYAFSSVGVLPQDLKFGGEETELIIGKRNSIRNYVNLSIGTAGGGGKTIIGDDNLFMVHVHVAHDCHVQDRCVFANGVSLAGHVEVNSDSVLGGHAAVHQFCRIGLRAMIAGGSMVVQDVPPYCMVHGDRAVPNGLNVVGLKRAGISGDELRHLKDVYRFIYKENLTVDEALERISKEIPASIYRDQFVDFVKQSKRGICR